MYMGKRQEMARKGALVRDLIDDNQYIEALQILDEMDLEAVESTADLNLFADLYEKAERIDKKKDIYYILYKILIVYIGMWIKCSEPASASGSAHGRYGRGQRTFPDL